jgi:hypothetical protein
MGSVPGVAGSAAASATGALSASNVPLSRAQRAMAASKKLKTYLFVNSALARCIGSAKRSG